MTETTTPTTDETTDSIPLDEAGEVRLPTIELLTGRGFITGKAGSGKSNTASVIAEELLSRGHPLLLVDTDGEYYGLKEEFEMLLVGADEECDLQVGEEHAEKLASLALEENVPIILDVSGYLDEAEANALVRETARHLFAKEKKLKKPFVMLVEECHEYIPEGGGLDDVGEMLVKVGKRGRKHGLGLVGISQRPADVKKDFITQANWLVWHRLTWENDTKVVGRVVGREYADAVSDLGDGEGFLVADFAEADVQRVQVRRKRTFDAGATPDLGDIDRPDLKSVSGDLVSELEEISDQEERRQDRISQLEATVDEREERIAELEDELAQARDMSEMADQFTQALVTQAGDGEDETSETIQQQIEEIREEKNSRITDLEQEREALRDDLRRLRREKADLAERVTELEEYEQVVENMDEIREALTRMNDAFNVSDGGDEQLRQRLADREDRIEELEAQVTRLEEQGGGVIVPTDYQAFLDDEDVREAIESAIDSCSASRRYVHGVVSSIVRVGGPVDYKTIAEDLGVSTTSDVSKASSALQTHGVIRKVSQQPAEVDLDMDGIEEIKERNLRREQADEIMQGLKDE